VSTDLAVVLAFAALGAVLIAWLLVTLTIRLRHERAAQPPGQRSRLWFLLAAGLGCYLFAYFAFGENLHAPWRLALAVLAVGSFPVVRRLLP
jgi:drug/metabolite transporter (DMT)-like permease